MSDKSFGDQLNRNIVKNPLLSSAVTGLSIEDLTHNAVLLPVAPTQELITRQDQKSGPQSATLAQPDSKHEKFLSGDANSNILHTNYPPTNKASYYDTKENIKDILKQQLSQSKASTKSDDDFDVNEYYARLQGTRYVSAPLNSLLKEDQKATLEATEENLEEINLNEPEKAQQIEAQQSLTADIAQNFSQLPTVLPQVASAVFSSFSNMLSMKSREQTPDEPRTKPSGYQEVQFQRSEELNVPLKTVDEPIAPKEVAPPPTQPPIGGTNYRITTKKKAYAQIPGLSSTYQGLNPPPNTMPYYQTDHSNLIPHQHMNISAVQSNETRIEPVETPPQVHAFSIFNPGPADDNTQPNIGLIKTEQTSMLIPLEVNTSFPPANESKQKEVNVFKTVESQEQITNLNITNTSIIPPPPMFSNTPKKDSQSDLKSVLPPSVARRIGSNHPIIKPQTLLTAVPTDNIFVPAPGPDIAAENFGVSSMPFPLDSNLPIKEDKSSMGSQSAFVQFNTPTANIESSSTTLLTDQMAKPPSVITSPVNATIHLTSTQPTQFMPQSDSKPPSNIPSITSQAESTTNLCSSPYASPQDTVPPPKMYNPNDIPSSIPLFKSPDGAAPPINQLPMPTFFNPVQQITGPQVDMQSISSSSNVDQNIMTEAPQSLPEPPKMAGNMSYRMTKKRPQYYSGPIEGVGAISNNVKPTISALEPSTFQGAVFTPDVQPTVEQPASLISAFDIDQHSVTQPVAAYPQLEMNHPPTQSYAPPEYNTAFDLSRQTTDNFEPPKQESKGFGIIGSLKSKLSSLDINKIQNSVTTFFDPTYNETKNETNNEGSVGYNAFNYQDGSLEVFVPSIDQSNQTGGQTYGQYNYHSPYNYGQDSYQIPSSDHGNGMQACGSQSYFTNNNYAPNHETQNPSYSTSYFNTQLPVTQTYNDPYTNTENTETEIPSLTHHAQVVESSPYAIVQKVESPSAKEEEKRTEDKLFQPAGEETSQPVQILNQENITSHKNDTSSIGHISAQLNDTSARNFFDNQQIFSLSQPVYSDELNKKLENLQITQIIQKEPSPDSNILYDKIKSDLFSNDSEILTPIDVQIASRLGGDFFRDLTPQHKYPDGLQSPLDYLGSKGNEDLDRFDTNDSIIGHCSVDSTSNDGTMDDIPRLDAPTILFGLPSIPPTQYIGDIDNNIEKVTLYEPPPLDIPTDDADFFDNIIDESKQLPKKCENHSELNICETCREFHKHEDKEVDDLTKQLIENITSPIQLSNPVVAELTESNTPIEERNDFDSQQCDEITHITEETIETIQVHSAAELLDDVDELNNINVRNYGWVSEEPAYPQSTALVDHDYSFQIDPNAIGFYGNNSMFFENMPNNASDEIKAEFQSSQDETPVVLQNQISIPSAPPAEDDDDGKSDETGILDVHSIEQDAKKDFPIFEEFVIEPSETDDDKIEYKERERSSDDPVQDIDTFTNRVERYKKMEEFVDKSDDVFDSQKNLFDLNDTNPAISMASYFDTGNYAAEAHYRNSISSPSMPFQASSTNIPFSIPPGFEDEYKRRLSAMAVQDDKKSDKDENVPYIPDTSTQTRPVITTTYSSVSPVTPNITDASTVTFSKHEETTTETQKLPAVFGHKPESGDNLASSLFAKVEDKPIAIFHEPKIIKEPEKPPLEDPISFFSNKDKSPKVETNDGGFNRLASYFAAPTKNEPSKSFFELSQSQNHYRHVNTTISFDSGVRNIDKACQNNKTAQTNTFHNIPTDVYLANLTLMNDLTSNQNIAFKPNDQIVRTINYFTVEYDNDIEIKKNIYEDHIKSVGKGILDEGRSRVEETVSDDANYVTVVSKCKFCCNNDFHRVIAYNKVDMKSDLKVRRVMDSGRKDTSSDNKTDRKPDMEPKAQDGSREVTVNFGNPLEEDSERVAIMPENRLSSAEYAPVKHHWFYRVDFEGKSIWRGFSATDNRALEDAFLNPDLDESTVVATDGGRFDVNIVGRLRTPVYWSDKPTNVRRCSWFYKGTTDARYVPYTESVAEKLEEEYRHGITTGEWHRRLVLPSRELVVLHGPAVMVHLAHPPDTLTAQPQSTMRPRVVRRGCDDTEIEDSEPSSIDHLLLLCHGVGSACDMRFRSVEEVVDDFRATSLQLVQSHYRNSCDQGVVNRVEVLPISWHATLHSGETGVDKRLSAITLDSIPRLRNFTNDTVLDVLFYTSPVFCQTIIDTVCAELNRIYRMFMARNPSFSGRVSLGGHSLGSVILYDLLCHQHPKNAPDQQFPSKNFVQGAAGTGQASVKYPALDFNPAALYALGSPIAMFECIRGVKSLGTDFCLPTCKSFFNIFHPYDPIAYRIEPLINAQLGSCKPFLIPHHKGRKRMHLELKDTMARVGADLKQKLIESLKSTWSSMWKSQPPPNDGQLEKVVEEEMEKEQLCEEVKEDVPQNNDFATPEAMGVLNAGRRVDYVLQEAPFEMINEYLFAMSSHVCYWESEDCMLLILKEIYDSLGVRPDCTVPQQSLTVQRTKNASEFVNVTTTDIPSTSRDST